ncbi:MAG: transposase [Alphaproteobacteria bacterium]
MTRKIRTAGVSPASGEAKLRLSRPEAGGPKADVGLRSRGYLPHVDAPNLVQRVVFRLADSLPAAIRAEIGSRPADERITALDAALDRGFGRRDLNNPVIAELVQTALLHFDPVRYRLLAWCVMPNHVHTLLQTMPEYSLDRIIHSWKSYTANRANRLLRRRGTFWAREYFDRFMRDEEHLSRTAAYIEANPVNAGLCTNISDWQFSSAWHDRTAGLRPACRRDAGGPCD